ncbi:MAG TPA: DUF1489 domain-containing protein [Acetobacteraceae bacterium]|nr:DUF1489 domain-containing protein [Acetobacteraceae bacterium]
MLHLMKLAVGVRDLPHLRALQAERARTDPPLCHRTRHFPRRAAEILAGGSIYWVIGGAMLARQPVRDIIEDTRADGSPCTSLVLDPRLVPVLGRMMKPFQGWRYLAAEAAPPDLRGSAVADGVAALPPTLRRELQSLCLI